MIEKIVESIEQIGEIDFSGVKLESADPRLLDVSFGHLNLHVVVQPSAIAYYGSLLKAAARKVFVARRQFERWEKKKWAAAKASFAGSEGRVTVQDIDARFVIDNEDELKKWDEILDKLQENYDTLSVWYEGWKQKSFSIQQQAGITEQERFVNEMGKENDKKKHIKDIIRGRQERESL